MSRTLNPVNPRVRVRSCGENITLTGYAKIPAGSQTGIACADNDDIEFVCCVSGVAGGIYSPFAFEAGVKFGGLVVEVESVACGHCEIHTAQSKLKIPWDC